MNENHANMDQLAVWWQQVLEGDTTVLGKIHNELFDGLYAYALKVTDDHDLANDAVQELFIKMWMKRFSIGNLEKVREYFFSSLRRQLINQLRNLKLRQLKIKDLGGTDIEFSPEEILVKNEENFSLKEKILHLINDLPKRQKEVIYLHYFQNLEYAEIARMMDINYQSVLNLTQKAMQTLRSASLFLFWALALFIFFKKSF